MAPDTEEVAEPAAPVSQPTQPPVEVTEVGMVWLAIDAVAYCGLVVGVGKEAGRWK